jgi:hypothetical protein
LNFSALARLAGSNAPLELTREQLVEGALEDYRQVAFCTAWLRSSRACSNYARNAALAVNSNR